MIEMAKKSSKHKKDMYALYRTTNRRRTNKIRKLTKYCKANPNDKQAVEALAAL